MWARSLWNCHATFGLAGDSTNSLMFRGYFRKIPFMWRKREKAACKTLAWTFLHMCCPMRSHLHFTTCTKLVQISKASIWIIRLWSCWLCSAEGERGSKNSNSKNAFIFFFVFTSKRVGLTVFCVLSKERILNFIYGLIFNSLNYSWFCPGQDCNCEKGTHCH